MESSTCSDVRALFYNRKEVPKLPRGKACKDPVYIVTGSRHRYGDMDAGRPESLVFPGEQWHKCCLSSNGKGLQCEKVPAIEHGELAYKHQGYCGSQWCMGERDRCLDVDKVNIKPEESGMSPSTCSKACAKARRECVHIGPEPDPGKEGNQRAFGPNGETEPYEVISLSVPSTLLSLSGSLSGLPQSNAADDRTRRRAISSNFLS